MVKVGVKVKYDKYLRMERVDCKKKLEIFFPK
jgi:hypothetical protein